MPTDPNEVFRQIALHYKLATAEQIALAVELAAPGRPLPRALLDGGFVSEEQHEWLLKAYDQLLAKQQRAAAEAQPAPAPVQPAAPQPAPSPRPALASSPEIAPSPEAAPARLVEPTSSPTRAVGERLLDKVLAQGVALGASDVHLHSGMPVQVRVHGRLLPTKTKPIVAARSEAMIVEVLSPIERERFQKHNDLDFAFAVPGVGRFRGNVYRHQRGVDAVFRLIPLEPPTLRSLGLPDVLGKLVGYHQGLVLVTGPAGCGKSSTLAALVDLVNEQRADHVITVEDPIEFVHKSKRCVVNQRQVQKHTDTFASALRAALREDPDVIVIGELRDLETIQLAITAAETGHLVLGTLHTNNTIRTVNRILDVFPPKQQAQIRAMFSESLRAVVSQRLVPTGNGRVPATEVLMVTPAVSNLIREEKVFQIRSILQTGRDQGMWLIDDSLMELVKQQIIDKETARRFCDDPKAFA